MGVGGHASTAARPQQHVREVLGLDLVALDHDQQALHRVAQLAYVAAPGVALQRLFATLPRFLRHTVHENTISAGLKTLALTGTGLCWLPESLVEKELRAGSLVTAAKGDDWQLDLQIRLYRALDSTTPITDIFWKAAKAIAAG